MCLSTVMIWLVRTFKRVLVFCALFWLMLSRPSKIIFNASMCPEYGCPGTISSSYDGVWAVATVIDFFICVVTGCTAVPVARERGLAAVDMWSFCRWLVSSAVLILLILIGFFLFRFGVTWNLEA